MSHDSGESLELLLLATQRGDVVEYRYRPPQSFV